MSVLTIDCFFFVFDVKQCQRSPCTAFLSLTFHISHYNEATAAEHFSSSWREEKFTRSQINRQAVVSGGLPSDNNAVEATNHAHKDHAGHQRTAARSYFKELGNFIHDKSLLDTDFGSYLNPEGCSKLFFLAVSGMFTSEVSPLTVAFPCSGGRVVIASSFLLSHSDFPEEHKTTATLAKKFLGQKNGWLQTWREISQNPHRHCSQRNFDECIDWAKSFHTLTPITHSSYLFNFHRRLVNSFKHPQHSMASSVMDLNAIVALGNRGLMACSCGKFLHRAWCIHSCVDAFKKGIITHYPPNMDPTNVACVGRGRPPIKTTRLHQQANFE